MKEAISINSGLLVLQRVMQALNHNSRKQDSSKDHVPYRESKLTRFLQVGRQRRKPCSVEPVVLRCDSACAYNDYYSSSNTINTVYIVFLPGHTFLASMSCLLLLI